MISILCGHVLERLTELPDESVHCVVTSPPYYGLRDYGTEPQVWGGDPGCAHEWGDAVVRKQLSGVDNEWSKDRYLRAHGAASTVPERKSAFCRHCNAWRGSLGLEPTLDLYLDHMVECCREIRRVLRKDGSLWLNIGDSYHNVRTHKNGGQPPQGFHKDRHGQPADGGSNRARPQPGLKEKDLMLIPSRLAIRLQEDGWWVRSEIVWAKNAPMPESVTDRPTSAHEKIFLLTKSARYFYDTEAVKERSTHGELYHGAYDKRPGAIERNGRNDPENTTLLRNLRNVWRLPQSPFPEAHFATFPPELPRRCILAGTRPGDTVLDPFLGAGTTALVADQLQRNCIGIELSPVYAEMAERRIRDDAGMFAEMAAD